MQLTCPKCGELTIAENINVQQMIAVCSSCDNVYEFHIQEPKTKRRKVSQPTNMMMRDDDNLYMSYRTNFRLDRNEAFLSSLFGSTFLTIFTIVFLTEGKGGVIMPIFGLGALLFYYWMASIVFNKTHIEVDDESIQVSRGPLPGLFSHKNSMNLSGVRLFFCEETPISVKEAYDTPRYHVWAERTDGSRKIIVTDLIEDYAYYIAQQLDRYLHEDDADLDVSRLKDSGGLVEPEQTGHQLIQTQEKHS